MKKWIPMLLLAAAVLWSPTRGTDVGRLIPVELVQILRTEQGFLVRTDTENRGVGETLDAAIADLKEQASGEIFLETAEYVLLTETSRGCARDMPAYFRPGTQIYQAPPLEDLAAAAEYLGQHSVPSPLFRLGEGERLPYLMEQEGGLRLETGNGEE